jgi:hypothetical protein
MIAATKICLTCNRSFHGRADKKFCNDYCRNTHHNQLNCDGNNYVRNINHSLRRNRRILENVLRPARQITKISRQLLQNKGFNFHYFTHIHINKKGTQYHFCYDYGFRVIAGEQVVVVRKNIEQGILDERLCEERSNLCFNFKVVSCDTACFVPRSDVLLHHSKFLVQYSIFNN